MREKLFSDDELRKFFSYKENERKRNPSHSNIVDIFYDMKEHLGFAEIDTFLKAVEEDSRMKIIFSKLNDIERQRIWGLMFLRCVGGSVEYNPPDLFCPECGSRYVAKITYGYLTKKAPSTKRQAPTEPLSYNNGDVIKDDFKYHCLSCDFKI